MEPEPASLINPPSDVSEPSSVPPTLPEEELFQPTKDGKFTPEVDKPMAPPQPLPKLSARQLFLLFFLFLLSTAMSSGFELMFPDHIHPQLLQVLPPVLLGKHCHAIITFSKKNTSRIYHVFPGLSALALILAVMVPGAPWLLASLLGALVGFSLPLELRQHTISKFVS